MTPEQIANAIVSSFEHIDETDRYRFEYRIAKAIQQARAEGKAEGTADTWKAAIRQEIASLQSQLNEARTRLLELQADVQMDADVFPQGVLERLESAGVEEKQDEKKATQGNQGS